MKDINYKIKTGIENLRKIELRESVSKAILEECIYALEEILDKSKREEIDEIDIRMELSRLVDEVKKKGESLEKESELDRSTVELSVEELKVHHDKTMKNYNISRDYHDVMNVLFDIQRMKSEEQEESIRNAEKALDKYGIGNMTLGEAMECGKTK